jgi:hypothetical protein
MRQGDQPEEPLAIRPGGSQALTRALYQLTSLASPYLHPLLRGENKHHRFCGAQGLAPQGFFPVAAHGLALGAHGFFAAQGLAPHGLAAVAAAR